MSRGVGSGGKHPNGQTRNANQAVVANGRGKRRSGSVFLAGFGSLASCSLSDKARIKVA